MKKKILLFSAFCCITALTLSSYESGPSSRGEGNKTGSNGGTTCATCHGGGSGTTTGTIEVRKKSNSTVVTNYVPDSVYTITLTGSNASLAKFGFQLTTVRSNNSSAGGTFSNFPAGVKLSTGNIVEHTTSLSKNGSGNYEVSFDWKAPSTDVGPITVSGVLNAVNDDNSTSGDVVSSNISKTLAYSANVGIVGNDVVVKTYPNPVKNMLAVEVTNATSGVYVINAFDITGRKMFEESYNTGSGLFFKTINTEKWGAGIYSIQIIKDGVKHTSLVMKD